MNTGLSGNLKAIFPNTIPVPRPLVVDQEIKDPNWVLGFTEAEGCFGVNISNSKTHKTGYQVQLSFNITQHSRDALLLSNIQKYLGCGGLYEYPERPAVCLTVSNFSDILTLIIPFYDKYPLQGNKKLDYLDFCKAALLVNDKAHLTTCGLTSILQIKNNMNKSRIC